MVAAWPRLCSSISPDIRKMAFGQTHSPLQLDGLARLNRDKGFARCSRLVAGDVVALVRIWCHKAVVEVVGGPACNLGRWAIELIAWVVTRVPLAASDNSRYVAVGIDGWDGNCRNGKKSWNDGVHDGRAVRWRSGSLSKERCTWGIMNV